MSWLALTNSLFWCISDIKTTYNRIYMQSMQSEVSFLAIIALIGPIIITFC